MAKKKTKKKANKKNPSRFKILKIASIPTALLIIGGVFFAYLVITSIINEEVTISLEPYYSSYNLKHGETASISIDTKLQTKWLCKAECSYELIRLSDNTILKSETFNVSESKIMSVQHEYVVEKFGEGQEILSLNVECSNIERQTCPSEQVVNRKSTITINYAPNEAQHLLKEDLEKKYALLISTVEENNILVKQIEIILQEITQMNFTEHIDAERKKLEHEKIVQKTRELTILWETQDFFSINDAFEDSGIQHTSDGLTVSANQTLESMNSKIEEFNLILETIKNVTASENYILLSSYPYLLAGKEEIQAIQGLSNITLHINSNLVNNYSYTLEQSENFAQTIYNETESKLQTAKNNYVDLFIADSNYCAFSGNCSANVSEYAVRIFDNTLKAEESIINLCNAGTTSFPLISAQSYESEIRKQNLTPAQRDFYEREELIFTLGKLRELESSIIIADARSSELIKIISSYKNIIISELNETNPVPSTNDTSYFGNIFSPVNERIKKLVDDCNPNNTIQTRPLIAQNASVPETNISSISISLPETKPMCCANNECRPCCNSEECTKENYPLILLHGHSFNKGTTPYDSTDVWNDIENKLMKENLYFSAGTIPYSNEYRHKKGDLGRNFLPLVIKPSYYFESYDDEFGLSIILPSKSESIDTYALRLRDIIEYTKYVTGKDKVDIVAHSMGGLVTRRYINIFGDESINTLIFVGTPHKGIDERTYSYCKIFGEQKECDDMNENGLFLNKLNSNIGSTLAKNTYSIIGTGCLMNEEDGDGIVLARSTQINSKETTIIQGTCDSLTSQLHSGMLDPEDYPETYETIKKFLGKS